MAYEIIILVVSFYIYCFLGWVWESIILPLSRKQKPYNSGFLNGPWIPIYGFGAMLVIVLFDIRKIDYPIYALFINGAVVACLLEYITSYGMEKIFHQRWWDYSHQPFNINGRVCLEGFVCFGVFSVVAIDYVQPFFTVELSRVNKNLLFVVAVVLTVVFVFDAFISTRVALNIEKKVEQFKQAIENNEVILLKSLLEKQQEVNKRIEKNRLQWQRQQIIFKNLIKQKGNFRYSQRRLIRAFPNLLKHKKKD